MAKIDFATITEPVSDEQPCGPDLDMEFDMDFMNFVAEIDGTIPTRFFGWDPSTLDFKKYYELIDGFLERTRDVRILVPLAKLKILQSDIAGFTEVLEAIHRLLKERWSDLHPQPAEFLDLSMGQLSTLDDMPNVVLPLQHATIVRSRRAGAITLRKWQLAKGEVNAREGEETIDLDTLSGGLAEADADELNRARETLLRARDAINGIRTVCIQEGGFDSAPVFERLPSALVSAIEMVETVTGGADSSEQVGGAGEVDAATGTVVVRLPPGAVANREEAVEAIHVAARYFALKEPSSPVPLLLREAEAASAKSFYELINDFVPDTAAGAFVSLGKEPWFDIHLSTLEARNPAPDYAAELRETEAAEDTGLGEDEVSGEDEADVAGDDWPVEGDAVAGQPAASDSDTDAADAAGETADTTDGAMISPAAAPATEQEVLEEPGGGGRKFVANSRPEAVALMEKVLAYYRVAEPTSPVSLLLERAIDLSSKSFIELLGKVLPDGSLRVREK